MLGKSGHSTECEMVTSSMQSKSANYRRCVLTIGLTRPEPSFLPAADGSSPCSGRSASLRDHPPKAVIGGRPRTAFQLLRGVPRPRLRKNVLPCDAVCWDAVCWDYPSYPVKRRADGTVPHKVGSDSRRRCDPSLWKNHRPGFGNFEVVGVGLMRFWL